MQSSGIFISHSSRDNGFCDVLVQALSDAGFDAWAHEHDSDTREAVPELVGAQFDRRPIFVILLSPAALASRWVQREWDMALSRASENLILVTVAPLSANAFQGRWRIAEPMRRIEAESYQPLPQWQAITLVLQRLGSSLDTLREQGNERIRDNDFKGAIPPLRVVTEARPTDVGAWAHLAYAQAEARQPAEALASSERALLLQPDRADVWNTKGWALNQLRLHAAALVASTRACELDNTQAYIWNTQSEALQGLGRLEEALVASERATSLDSTWKWGWMQKANVLRELGRPDDAEAAERQANEQS